jgi:uncharacterized protein (DUF983 family)
VEAKPPVGPPVGPPIPLSRIVLRGRCPRCGQGKLYAGLLTIVDQCSECKLDLTQHEQGDGPAFFGILIVGAATAIGAAVVEIKYQPSFWLHAAIWVPFVLLGSVLSLRLLKALLIAVQYQLRKDDFR